MIMSRMTYRAMRWAMGPRMCVKCAAVMGNVAMRIQVETWDRSEKRPDWERARKLVPKSMEEEIRHEEALE